MFCSFDNLFIISRKCSGFFFFGQFVNNIKKMFCFFDNLLIISRKRLKLSSLFSLALILLSQKFILKKKWLLFDTKKDHCLFTKYLANQDHYHWTLDKPIGASVFSLEKWSQHRWRRHQQESLPKKASKLSIQSLLSCLTEQVNENQIKIRSTMTRIRHKMAPRFPFCFYEKCTTKLAAHNYFDDETSLGRSEESSNTSFSKTILSVATHMWGMRNFSRSSTWAWW